MVSKTTASVRRVRIRVLLAGQLETVLGLLRGPAATLMLRSSMCINWTPMDRQ
jgi:hypothetical protein